VRMSGAKGEQDGVRCLFCGGSEARAEREGARGVRGLAPHGGENGEERGGHGCNGG
jgi:hypothetical protein